MKYTKRRLNDSRTLAPIDGYVVEHPCAHLLGGGARGVGSGGGQQEAGGADGQRHHIGIDPRQHFDMPQLSGSSSCARITW